MISNQGRLQEIILERDLPRIYARLVARRLVVEIHFPTTGRDYRKRLREFLNRELKRRPVYADIYFIRDKSGWLKGVRCVPEPAGERGWIYRLKPER